MNAKVKSNSVVTATRVLNTLVIEVLGAGKIEFLPEKCSEQNREQAMWHGFTQRLSDRAAKQAPTRKPGMDDQAWAAVKTEHALSKFNSIKELSDHLMSGDVPWRMAGSGSNESGLLFTALCRLKPNLTTEQVGKFIESRTDEQMKAVRLNKDVVEQMNAIRLERLGDTGSNALDELDSI